MTPDETNAKLLVRKAVLDDLPRIIAMLADDKLGKSREDISEPLNSSYASAFHAIDADANQMLVAVEESGEIVGCLQLTFIPGLSRLGMLRGQIEGVRIASTKRAHGIGRFLLNWAIAECRSRGCGVVQLTTDKSRADALRFYESLGFKVSHEGLKLNL